MAKLEDLESEVAELKTVADSAVALIEGLADKLEEAQDDPEQIAEIITDLRSSKEALAAAVAANTQPEPEPGADA